MRFIGADFAEFAKTLNYTFTSLTQHKSILFSIYFYLNSAHILSCKLIFKHVMCIDMRAYILIPWHVHEFVAMCFELSKISISHFQIWCRGFEYWKSLVLLEREEGL